MQRKYRTIDEVQEAADAFIRKHLRYSTLQEQRLELDFQKNWGFQTTTPDTFEIPKEQYPSLYKPNTDDSNFYHLVCLFFPETSSQPPLDIHLLDTLFFLPDNTLCYIYKDQRRGLVKLKQRGIFICDSFIKRKGKKREPHKQGYRNKQSANQDKNERALNSNLDYMVLLRYKDNSFLRLKEADFRSIFTNPLYANERFRHHNCTQYIQALPQEDHEQISIHYHHQQFQGQSFMNAAINAQLGKNTEFGSRQTLKQSLLKANPTVYLYYLAFEVAAYVAIHYNKQLETANFHFVCEDGLWTLSNVQSIKISNLPQKQYIRAELWDSHKVHFKQEQSFSAQRTPIFQEKPKKTSLLFQTIENFLDETNSAIKKDVTQFVKDQINKVRKTQDQKVSKAIFDILHPGQGARFYQCLNSPQKLKKAIQYKQQLPESNKTIKMARTSVKGKTPRPRSSLLQQIVSRQAKKQQFVYQGLYG